MSAPTISDGATSSWRALSPDHLQQQQQQQQGTGGATSVAMSPIQQQRQQQQQYDQQQQHYEQQQQQQAGSAGVSPIKGSLGSLSDDTVVYSALSRPLPDYALIHVFSQVGPGVLLAACLPACMMGLHDGPASLHDGPASLPGRQAGDGPPAFLPPMDPQWTLLLTCLPAPHVAPFPCCSPAHSLTPSSCPLPCLRCPALAAPRLLQWSMCGCLLTSGWPWSNTAAPRAPAWQWAA